MRTSAPDGLVRAGDRRPVAGPVPPVDDDRQCAPGLRRRGVRRAPAQHQERGVHTNPDGSRPFCHDDGVCGGLAASDLIRQARAECEWVGTLAFGTMVVWLATTLVADGLEGGA